MRYYKFAKAAFGLSFNNSFNSLGLQQFYLTKATIFLNIFSFLMEVGQKNKSIKIVDERGQILNLYWICLKDFRVALPMALIP